MVAPLNFVSVQGTYADTKGSPLSGKVVFTSRQTFVLNGETVIVPATVEAQLNANGSFSANLAQTDGNYSNQGWTYTVAENFAGGRTFNIVIPANTGTIDLSSYAPSLPPAPTFQLAKVSRTGNYNDLINLPDLGPGANVTITVTATVPVSSGQVVAINNSGAFIPDLTVSTQVIQIAGIATTSATAGNTIEVLPAGTMQEALWHWNVGPLYCSTSGGALTQTIQTVGAIQQVGFATSLNTIEVNIYPAILL